MVKHTQTNYLSVFDHFMGLALKDPIQYFYEDLVQAKGKMRF